MCGALVSDEHTSTYMCVCVHTYSRRHQQMAVSVEIVSFILGYIFINTFGYFSTSYQSLFTNYKLKLLTHCAV